MARKEDGMQFEVHPTPLKDKKGNNYVCVKPALPSKKNLYANF